MQITRQADYAVRAVVYLAERGQYARVTTAEIGREKLIPLTFLAKIMSQLTRAGIVRSTRGAHGGMTIGGPLDTITLLDVVEAIDGPVMLNECVVDPTHCPLGANCAVHAIWCQAQADLVDRLGRTTLQQLVVPKPVTALAPVELMPMT
jgi:Rrf2 family protein